MREKFSVNTRGLAFLLILLTLLGVILSGCQPIKNETASPITAPPADPVTNFTVTNSTSCTSTLTDGISDESSASESETGSPEPTPATVLELSEADIARGGLILISAAHPFEASAEFDDTLVSLYPVGGGAYKLAVRDLYLNSAAYDGFVALTAALKRETGFADLLVVSAYGKDKAISPESEFASGLAVELKIYTSDGKTYSLTDPKYVAVKSWLAANAAKYGFIQRVDTPSFLRFAGVAAALYITEHGIGIEQFISAVYEHSQKNPLIYSFYGVEYRTFFVPLGDDGARVAIPSYRSLFYSGDNVRGVVVIIGNDGEIIDPPPPSDETSEATTPESTTSAPTTSEPTTFAPTSEPPTSEVTTPEPTTVPPTSEPPVTSEPPTSPDDNSLYPRPYRELVEAASVKYGVSVERIYAVMRTESFYDPNAVSRAGAVGLMQLMPSTFLWIANDMRGLKYKASDAYDPAINIDCGVWFLRYLYRYFGSWNEAHAAYNAGQGNVIKWLADERYTDADGNLDVLKIPFVETRTYVIRINEVIAIYTAIYYATSEENDE